MIRLADWRADGLRTGHKLKGTSMSWKAGVLMPGDLGIEQEGGTRALRHGRCVASDGCAPNFDMPKDAYFDSREVASEALALSPYADAGMCPSTETALVSTEECIARQSYVLAFAFK